MGNLTVKENGEMINFISPNVNNITSFKVHFSPRQEGSGDPSPENVREITGWNGVKGYNTCDINLFNYTSDEIKNGYRNNNGDEIVSSSSLYTVTSYPVQPNQQLFISSSKNDGFSFRLYYLTQDEQWIRRDSSWRTCTQNYTIITIPLNCYKIQLQFTNSDLPDLTTLQIRIISTTTTDWTEDVGTVYGGYVDLISGELVQTHGLFTVDEPDASWRLAAYNRITINFPRKYIFGSRLMPNISICTLLPNNHTNWNYGYIDNVASINNPHALSLNYTGDGEGWSEPFGEEATAENIKTHLEQLGFAICAPLATPITHQLTPQQLSTLKGQNNFWSNADYVEIEYELTETFDIQKAKRKIILNQPHVESASGDVVTFDTDMKGRLKECKVYFSPVQEGSGDPSPDNVRNIVGWNGVSVGELPSEYQEVEYIEKNIDNQYIDTGILGNGELHVDCKINISQINNGAPFFGSYGNSQRCYFLIQNNGNKVGYSYITTTYSSVLLNENNDYHINAIFNSGEQSLFINDELILSTNTTQSLKTNKNIYLFGYNFNGTFDIDRSAIFKLYYFKLYQNGTLVRNFIPCYRKSDNEIGMYDTVSKQFFTNQGTGTFLKGDDVDGIYGSIDWTEDIGTVYGGYVDLVSGELVQEYSIFDLETTVKNIQQFSSFKMWFSDSLSTLGIDLTPSSNSSFKGYCDVYPILPYNANAQITDYNVSVRSDGNRRAIYVRTDGTSDIKPIGNIVLKLATPIIHQLTPQQLTALRGTNNVYSNTNGQTEIKYWKH